MSKRINLTVTDETYQALTELQQITGLARASFAGQMLEESRPMLQKLIEAARDAHKAPQESLAAMQKALIDSQEESQELQKDLLEKGTRLRRWSGE